MFEGCTSFNSIVEVSMIFHTRSGDCARMFKNASSYNQPFFADLYCPYDRGLDMSEMFAGATAFDQDISNWTIEGVDKADGFMDGVTLSTANYDSLLFKWSGQNIFFDDVNISFGNSQFCTSDSERDTLQLKYGWNIEDKGYDFSCLPLNQQFITTWRTTTPGETITIPTYPGEIYDYGVDWGDGVSQADKTGNATHAYADTGLHTVKIYGTFPRIYFNDSGDKTKLISVDRWSNRYWTSMEHAFHGCSNLTISTPDKPKLDSVTNMSYMFAGCSSFNSNINNWNVESVENVSHLFEDCISFNQPLGDWDLVNVKNLSYVFSGCTSFNQTPFNNLVGDEVYTLGSISASYAFYNCVVFNQPVPWINVEGDITSMFEGCTSFNSTVDVSFIFHTRPGNCARMFKNASSYNQPFFADLYCPYDRGLDMSEMFAGATAFNQDISNWIIEGVDKADGFMDSVTLSTANYDSLLAKWSQQNIFFNDVNISFGNSKYCSGAEGRSILENTYGWTVTDGGIDEESEACANFVTTWVTTPADQTITLTVDVNQTYDYDVDWNNDGVYDSLGVTGAITHDYGTADTVTIRIRGQYPAILFNTSPNKANLISVDQWGSQVWKTMSSAFYGCTNVHINASDAPDLSQVTNMSYMFWDCASLNESINHWDVSNVTQMPFLFRGATKFNQAAR